MGSQMVQVGYKSRPDFDATAIAERAAEVIGSSVEIGSTDPLMLSHTNHVTSFADAEEVPAQTVLLPDSGDTPSAEALAEILQQSWDCEDAAERVAACSHFPLLSEMLARALEPGDRLKLFHGVLQAVVELTEPTALIFQHGQQVIAPQRYLASCSSEPELRAGSINVRLFNISNSDTDAKLMDTRGMEEIGLHDVQCHFHSIEPGAVAQILFNAACYIVEHGPVIEAGHTLEGHLPDELWLCQFEDSLVAPDRVVLDLNPGPSFAAGTRDDPPTDGEAAE